MEVNVFNWDNEKVGQKELEESVFSVETRLDIVHRIVTWQQAKARGGNHKTKQRAEVAGSTRKIYNQKGSGRARHGSIKAPIFVGGGTVFGPVVRSHAFKLNKKVVQLGLKSTLSNCLKNEKIIILDNVNLENRKTSEIISKIKNFNFNNEKILIIDATINENLKLSCSNLHKVNVLPVKGINVLDLIRHGKVLITSAAIDELQQRLVK